MLAQLLLQVCWEWIEVAFLSNEPPIRIPLFAMRLQPPLKHQFTLVIARYQLPKVIVGHGPGARPHWAIHVECLRLMIVAATCISFAGRRVGELKAAMPNACDKRIVRS